MKTREKVPSIFIKKDQNYATMYSQSIKAIRYEKSEQIELKNELKKKYSIKLQPNFNNFRTHFDLLGSTTYCTHFGFQRSLENSDSIAGSYLKV